MFSVSSFIKSNRRNFIANNEWSPVHPTSIDWIIRLGGNAGVLLQSATEVQNSSQVYRCTLADLVCLAEELSRCMECSRGIAMGILSVCLSVCPSNAWIVTKRKKAMFRFLYHMKEHLS